MTIEAKKKYTGSTSTSVLNGQLRLEEGNNRLIVSDSETDILLIGQRPDGQIVVDLANVGFDVKTADINDLVFSSRFNLYKIIHYGFITSPTPRNATVTLSGNNIGYVFDVYVDVFNGTGDTQLLEGDLLMNICWDFKKTPITGSGLFYDDGTNKVQYKWSTGNVFNSPYIHVRYELRLLAGSYAFNPATSGRVPFARSFYYQVANMTNALQSGMGGTGTGDGKFYYLDQISYYPDGTVKTALASSTLEFINGNYAYFPSAIE
jgi:hypothetical protein